MDSINYTKRIFVYYFKLAFEAAGLRWDSDNQSEIEEAINEMVKALRVEIAAEVSRRMVEDSDCDKE